MELSYIILAHKNPEQLNRLVKRLNENCVSFYIHIDRNTNITPFIEALSEYSNVEFLRGKDRHPGIWGDIGIVKGTLAAMHKVIDHGRSGYTVLLSGQDYPLKKNKDILDFFKRNETNYIDTNPIKNLWKKHGTDRIVKYKINKSEQRGHFLLLPSIFDRDFYQVSTLGKLNYLRKTGKFKSFLKIFKMRKFPANMQAYGGSQWWALNHETVIEILHFTEKNPTYLKFHENSLLPDEFFFHSIVCSIKDEKKIQISNSITYTNWLRPKAPKPVTFEKTDFDELKKASELHLYARKFDLYKHSDIMDKIDTFLLT